MPPGGPSAFVTAVYGDPCIRCGHPHAHPESSYCHYCREVIRVCYQITEAEYATLTLLGITVPQFILARAALGVL